MTIRWSGTDLKLRDTIMSSGLVRWIIVRGWWRAPANSEILTTEDVLLRGVSAMALTKEQYTMIREDLERRPDNEISLLASGAAKFLAEPKMIRGAAAWLRGLWKQEVHVENLEAALKYLTIMGPQILSKRKV